MNRHKSSLLYLFPLLQNPPLTNVISRRFQRQVPFYYPYIFCFASLRSQTLKTRTLKKQEQDVPCGPLAKNLPVNAGDTGSIPGLGRSLTPWGNGAREPQLLKSVHPGVHLCRKRRGHSEQPACQGRAAPARRSQRKPAHQQRPSAARNEGE